MKLLDLIDTFMYFHSGRFGSKGYSSYFFKPTLKTPTLFTSFFRENEAIEAVTPELTPIILNTKSLLDEVLALNSFPAYLDGIEGNLFKVVEKRFSNVNSITRINNLRDLKTLMEEYPYWSL